MTLLFPFVSITQQNWSKNTPHTIQVYRCNLQEWKKELVRKKRMNPKLRNSTCICCCGTCRWTCCILWPRAAWTAGRLAICCASRRFCWEDCWLAAIWARTSCGDWGGGRIFCICVNLHRKQAKLAIEALYVGNWQPCI